MLKYTLQHLMPQKKNNHEYISKYSQFIAVNLLEYLHNILVSLRKKKEEIVGHKMCAKIYFLNKKFFQPPI